MMQRAKDAIAHLKSLIYCILAGAKVLTCHIDKHPNDPDRDYTLKISIKHQNKSANRSEMIQDHITGLKTESYPDHDF